MVQSAFLTLGNTGGTGTVRNSLMNKGRIITETKNKISPDGIRAWKHDMGVGIIVGLALSTITALLERFYVENAELIDTLIPSLSLAGIITNPYKRIIAAIAVFLAATATALGIITVKKKWLIIKNIKRILYTNDDFASVEAAIIRAKKILPPAKFAALLQKTSSRAISPAKRALFEELLLKEKQDEKD
jgi:hypothetical protein